MKTPLNILIQLKKPTKRKCASVNRAVINNFTPIPLLTIEFL